ncbi:unnamed protein product [Amaranthus hypochondriacus]
MPNLEIQPQSPQNQHNTPMVQETPSPTNNQNPHSQRHRVTSLNTDVIIQQLPSQGLSFQLWPAATTLFSLLDTRLLDKYLPNTCRRLRILELGSGTGLVGISAAAILGAEVTVTDLPHVIPNLEFNVSANTDVIAARGGGVVAKELSWGNVDQMVAVGREYDVIMGSDVVYHDHLYDPLLETLKYFVVGEGMFLMAHLKRWKKEAAFFKKARKLFDVDVIHRDNPSDGVRVGVMVYRFVPKQRPCTVSNC